MSNSRPIGSLYIDIEARTAKIEQDLARARMQIEKFAGGARGALKQLTGFDIGALGKNFLKFSLLLDGVRSGLHALANAVKDVFQNAKTYGEMGLISPTAAATISDATDRWNILLAAVRRGGAELIAGALNFGEAAVRGFGGWLEKLTQGNENIKTLISMLPGGIGLMTQMSRMLDELDAEALTIRSPDERQKLDDPVGWNTRAAAARDAYGKAVQESLAKEAIGMDKVLRLQNEVIRLREAAAQVDPSVQFNPMADTVKYFELMTEAQRKEAEAVKGAAEYTKQTNELLRQKGVILDNNTRKGMTDREQLKSINAELEKTKQITENPLARMGMFSDSTKTNAQGDVSAPSGEEYLAALRTQNGLLEKQGQITAKLRAQYDVLGEAIAGTLVRGIIEGKKFGEIMQALLLQIAEFIIQQYIVRTIGTWIGGGLMALGSGILDMGSSSVSTASTVPGSAVGGPMLAGRTHLVGENGPELFTADTSGTITPADEMHLVGRGSEAGGGYTYAPTYNITSGVTANELAPILRRHEQQIRANIMNDVARGGMRAARFGR